MKITDRYPEVTHRKIAKSHKYPDLMPVLEEYATVSRDHEYVRYGTISLLAGIDLLTGTFHYRIFDEHRSIEFIEFLKRLDLIYTKHMRIVIILDNVLVHTSKKTLEYLKTVPQRFHFRLYTQTCFMAEYNREPFSAK